MSRDGYLPCGVSGNEPIFGTNDHDVSYSAIITITSSLDIDKLKGLNHDGHIAIALSKVKQRYFGVKPHFNTYKLIEQVDDYLTFSFDAEVEGDTTIDMSYIDVYDDDDEIYSEVVEDIINKLNEYGIYEDEIDLSRDDISYEVH